MALKIKSFTSSQVKVERHSDLSAANTALTVTIVKGSVRQILFVTVKWSASVTKNVVITLKSGLGSAYDTILRTIALAPGTDGVWIPDAEIIIVDDDAIAAVSDAGGAGIIATLAIYTKVL